MCKYANLDQVNPAPGNVILSGGPPMMLRYNFRGGWTEAADLIIKGIEGATSGGAAKTVTYDFHRMMDGATKLKCSEFGDAIIKHMGSGSSSPKPEMALS